MPSKKREAGWLIKPMTMLGLGYEGRRSSEPGQYYSFVDLSIPFFNLVENIRYFSRYSFGENCGEFADQSCCWGFEFNFCKNSQS
jgi:hypothetical protein